MLILNKLMVNSSINFLSEKQTHSVIDIQQNQCLIKSSMTINTPRSE